MPENRLEFCVESEGVEGDQELISCMLGMSVDELAILIGEVNKIAS